MKKSLSVLLVLIMILSCGACASGSHDSAAARTETSAPENLSAPTDLSAPKVESLHIMFFTAEIISDITIWAGDDIDLSVQVMPPEAGGAAVEWISGNPDILQIEKTGEYDVHVAAVDNGSLPANTTLTVTCGGIEKQITVYCRPDITD